MTEDPDSMEGAGTDSSGFDHRHTHRLFALLAIVLVVAAVARWLAAPEDFGSDAYYRSVAGTEASARAPRHLGETACAECHDDKAELHDKDVHATVPCESCHGPGDRHVAADGDGNIVVPAGRKPCLVCHGLLPARPGSFPQIRWRDHYRFVGVAAENVDCTRCHDPHEPLYLDRDLRTARLHPLIHRCRDCHQGREDDTLPRPTGHPEIFECRYCHGPVVEDFRRRTHHGVSCTTCHLFIKENDFSGRIIRDADPRFCLLCHREADFRGPGSPPGIEWPVHRADMSAGPEDDDKRCIDCHRDRIHAPLGGERDEP